MSLSISLQMAHTRMKTLSGRTASNSEVVQAQILGSTVGEKNSQDPRRHDSSIPYRLIGNYHHIRVGLSIRRVVEVLE